MSVHAELTKISGLIKALGDRSSIRDNPEFQSLVESADAIDLMLSESILSVWSVGDVTALLPNLSDHQAVEVLKAVEHDFDASLGINWDTIIEAANALGYDTSHEFDELEEDMFY